MAGDTRDTPTESGSPSPKPSPERGQAVDHSKAEYYTQRDTKLNDYASQPERPEKQQSRVVRAAKTITWQDHLNFYKMPCVRDTFLVSIPGGFAVGGLRLVLGASLNRAVTWTLGSFLLLSIGIYERCEWKRAEVRDGMKRAYALNMQRQLKKAADDARQKQQQDDVNRAADELRQQKWWNVWNR